MGVLRTRLKFGKRKDVYMGSADYIGRTLKQMADYEIKVSMRRYITEKLNPATLHKDRVLAVHCYGSEKKADLMWEQPVQWLCRGAPTVEHILMANKTVKEIKATPDVELRVLPLEPHQAIWMSVADASMANVESKSQGGLIIALVDKVLQTGAAGDFSINSWRSHRLRRVVKATLGSEALAMDDALAELEWIRALWCEVMNKDSCVLDGARLGGDESILAVRVKDDEPALHVTDAKALYDLLQTKATETTGLISHPEGTATGAQLTLNIVVCGLGTGILTLPWSLAGASLIFGVAIIAAVLVVNAWTILLLVEAAETYQVFDLGGLLAHLPGRLGHRAPQAVNAAIWVSGFLCLVSYVLVLADCGQPFLLAPSWRLKILVSLLVLPICFLDQRWLSLTSSLSVAAVGIVFWLLLKLDLQDHKARAHRLLLALGLGCAFLAPTSRDRDRLVARATQEAEVVQPTSFSVTVGSFSGSQPEGKVAVITGASAGIGLSTVEGLARSGIYGTIVMAGRDSAKHQEAMESLREKLSRASGALARPVELRFLELDLASLASVRSFEAEFRQLKKPLHTLLLNAGVMALPERQQTADGYEYQFGVNHLGHFLLCNLLLDALHNSGGSSDPSRVIVLSSSAHQFPSKLLKGDLTDLQSF
ncbi:unnamed protein product, partial [Effrenium voratum]